LQSISIENIKNQNIVINLHNINRSNLMKNKLVPTCYKLVFIFSLFLVTTLGNAQTIFTSWTFDPVQGTFTNPTPNFGSGVAAIVNLVTPLTATGFSSTTGCGSANSGLGWQHQPFNPGATNEVNGVQFNSGTVGYTSIIFSWDQRFSGTAPNTVRLQYTTNGSTWTNFTMTGANTTICAGSINGSGCYETNAGNSYRRVRVDMSSIVAANNNPNFGIRLLASYYQSTGQYRQSSTPTAIASTTGAWRFDNVNFLGTPTTSGAIISGSTTICPATSANITTTIIGGTAPYTVVYSDGTTNYTVNNYTSGSNISVSPTATTTTYTLVSVTDSASALISPTSGSAIVTQDAGISPTFIASAPPTTCPGTSITYTTQTGMDPYTWTFYNGASPAVLGTDYNIVAGATTTETVTVQWLLASGTATFTAAVTYSSCSGASASSATVITLPTVTFTTQPGATACQNTDTTYTTQSGQANYVWTFSGTLGTDYTITSGGTSSSNTVVVKWLNNTSAKTVSVNYTNASGCTAAAPTTSTATAISLLPASIAFTVTPAANVCAGSNVTYTTLGGRFNYSWTFPGLLGTDYNIVSGGTSTSNTVILNWITSGSKTVTVNYSNQSAPNCGATSPATYTNNVNVVPTITSQPSIAAQTTCLGTPFSPISVTATGVNLTFIWWGNTTPTYILTSPTGGSPVPGQSTATFTAPATTAGVKYYYVQVLSSGCSSAKSTFYTAAYTVNPVSVGGSIAGSTTVCSGTNTTTLTLSGHTGAITKWQSASDAAFTTPVDIANTVTTLTVTNLTATTYYRAVIASGVCPSANSATATITVSPVSVGGTIAGAGTICSNTTTILSLSGYTGSITKWQSASDAAFTTPVDIANTTPTLSVTNLATTTYYRAVIQSSPCSLAYSASAQLLFKATTWNGFTWSNSAPDSTTKAIFGALYNSAGGGAGDLQACSLEVLTNAIVTVNSGDTFTIQNEIKIPASMLPTALIFEDSANLIQVNNVVNTDYIYYRRNTTPVKQYDYTYWSSPVASEVLSTFSPNTTQVFQWDTSIYNWSFVSTASTMNVGTGYIVRAPDAAPFNPTTTNIFNGEFFGIPNNGILTTPIVVTGANNLNLIGNPYPSALDADSFITYNLPANGGVLAGTMYFWTHNTPITANNYTSNDYASYNLTGGVGTMAASNPCAGCNSSMPNGKVAAGQAFFIPAQSSGVATYTNSMRSAVNNQFFKSNAATTAIEKNRFWLDISNAEGLYKQLLVGYIEGATNDIDPAYDGKSIDVGNPIMIYSVEGDAKLAIQGRGLPFNQNDEIAIGYKSTVASTFEFKLSNFDGLFINQDIIIEDTLQNVFFNLKNGNYSFETAIGTFDSRFKLHFIDTSTLHSNSVNAASFVVYTTNNQTTINAGTINMKQVTLFDIQGRMLQKHEVKGVTEYKFVAPVQNQVIILKITTSDDKIFFKKIVI
jgi:hypothetical protein